MRLLPMPSLVEKKEGFLISKKVYINNYCDDVRIEKALAQFDVMDNGVNFIVRCNGAGVSESYTLDINESGIEINGTSSAGVFYGIQTLKQLFLADAVPYVHIEDKPDMKYRGFYHDITRGKVPTVERIKKLIDKMAFYKMNSLQLYVEHTFPFKELGNLVERTGCLTPEEIKELDDYCYDNFIEFIPSIATFGHLYELLQLEEYKDLQAIDGYEEDQHYWPQRMLHHTIDPTVDRSFEVIKSMIDQYIPLFRTDKFNICCDETMDLAEGKHKDKDTARLYINFVKKIIAYLESKGKSAMMWGDILLEYPDAIKELPESIELLNWWYDADLREGSFKVFAESGRSQIVCPGTSTWSRLVESVSVSDINITKMLDRGYTYNAVGMLNTNWGDYGNPCSLELAMHGLILGASKSWNKNTTVNDEFNAVINAIEYGNKNATKYLYMLDSANNNVSWNNLAYCYSNALYEKKFEVEYPQKEKLEETVSICQKTMLELSSQVWEHDEYRVEMLIAAEGLTVIAELFEKLAGYDMQRVSDTTEWLKKYRSSWLKYNKESELSEIEKMFITLENI